MRIYVTTDKNGIDGFGFNEDQQQFRKLRAMANSWRGMYYLEGDISDKNRIKLLNLFKRKKYIKAKEFILKVLRNKKTAFKLKRR